MARQNLTKPDADFIVGLCGIYNMFYYNGFKNGVRKSLLHITESKNYEEFDLSFRSYTLDAYRAGTVKYFSEHNVICCLGIKKFFPTEETDIFQYNFFPTIVKKDFLLGSLMVGVMVHSGLLIGDGQERNCITAKKFVLSKQPGNSLFDADISSFLEDSISPSQGLDTLKIILDCENETKMIRLFDQKKG